MIRMGPLMLVVSLAVAGAAAAKSEGGAPVVLMSTSKGDIKIELDREKAPITVENFLRYVKDGHYNGTIFHRVIRGFMIQGGGFDENMKQKKTRDPIKNEAQNGLENDTGTIAMARTSDPDSATAQFFINVADNDALNYPRPDGHGYAVFGKVTEGMEVVRAIESVPTTSRAGHRDVPEEPVVIESVQIVSE